MDKETKYYNFGFDVKSVNSEGLFEGYASVFDVVDSQKDVISKGAFERTLKGREGAIKLLWQHDISEPIGIFDKIFEDSKGLFVRGCLLLDVQRGKEAHTLLKNGALDGMSIGYTVVDADFDDDGVRIIKDVDLWEVSLVTFPANGAAGVTMVKSDVPQTIREFERFLRESGYSRSKARGIASIGFKDVGLEDLVALDMSINRAIENLEMDCRSR